MSDAADDNVASSVRVALCQILVLDGDREGNFVRIERALSRASDAGADIALLPESCILGWENPDAHEHATTIPGTDSERLADLARRFGLWIVVGLDEKDGDRLYDSAVVINAQGQLIHKHRKIDVLPDLMSPPYSEGLASDLKLVATPWGRVGLVICADTLNDEFMTEVEQLEPDLLLVPYGWAAPSDAWPGHAGSLVSVVTRRASQLECPVVGVNAVGVMTHGPWTGYVYGGSSLAAHADGSVVVRLADRDVDVQTVSLRVGTQASR